MERVFQRSRNFKQAEQWDIMQHVSMTPEQRQEAAEQLRHRVYGKDAPDVRKAHSGNPRKRIRKGAMSCRHHVKENMSSKEDL